MFTFITKKSLTTLILISVILGSFFATQNSKAAINKQFNYQGKLTNSSGLVVDDGAFDFVFKIYTEAGGTGAAVWTGIWTNAALWTETGTTTITADHVDCGTGYTKIDYLSQTNESSLQEGQYLWNTTQNESAAIKSVVAASNYICIDTPFSGWATTDDLTNRIYIKDGLFSVMLGSITSLPDFTGSQKYYLGVKAGADANEMIPRKLIGSVPQAWNANNVVGDGYVDIDNTSTSQNAVNINYNPASGTYDALDITYGSGGGTGTAISVTQSGTGNIINLTGDSITTGTGMALSVDGLTTGTGLDITSTSTAGGASGTSKLLNLSRSGANAQLAHTAYGLYSAVTNTNATSGTNIGGYFSASGATTANYGLIVENGDVGIGTAAPGAKLEVEVVNAANKIGLIVDQDDVTNNPVAVQIENAGTGNSLSIDQNGNVGTTITTDGALFVENTGNTGIGLNVYSNLGATSDAGLVYFTVDNTGFDQTVLTIQQDGTDDALSVTSTSTGSIANLTGDSITTGTGMALSVDGLTTGTGLDITSTSTAGGASGTSKLLNLSRSGANAQLAHTAYGLYSAVTNTNATSGTNIGGYFSASGATTANYGLIVENGDVGIGTAAPVRRLDVLDTTGNTPQLRLTHDADTYSEFYVNSTGDLSILLTDGSGGDDIRILDENLWVCSGGTFASPACPSVSPVGAGNLVVAGKIYEDTTALEDKYLGIPAGPAQGDILYYNGSSWTNLGHGTDGQFLMTQGASANPVWSGDAFVCGTSTVTFKYRGGSVTYGTVVSNTTPSECWLDRNLGAAQVATASTDSAAYGDLFQWGRLSDNHEDRASGTTATNSSIDNPYHSNFITEGSNPYDWRVPQKDGLWQGVNGINNPCPDGWRIPTETEWNTERLAWSSNNAAGAFGSPLKLTVAGYRYHSDGSLGSVGTHGYYWSSSVSTTYARFLSFSAGASMVSNGRAYGFSGRCLKD